MGLMYNEQRIVGVRFVDNTGAPLTDGAVQGTAASGAADSGNPVKVGGRYAATPSTLTDGQRGDMLLDTRQNLRVALYGADSVSGITYSTTGADGVTNARNGIYVYSRPELFNGSTHDRQRGDVNGAVVQSGLSSTFWNYAAAASGIVSSTADVAIKAAAGASVRNYLKTLTIGHDTLSAVTEIVVKDGSTVLWRGKLQTGAVDTASASVIQFDPPLKGTANTALNVALLSSVTGGVYVNATGFTGS